MSLHYPPPVLGPPQKPTEKSPRSKTHRKRIPGEKCMKKNSWTNLLLTREHTPQPSNTLSHPHSLPYAPTHPVTHPPRHPPTQAPTHPGTHPPRHPPSQAPTLPGTHPPRHPPSQAPTLPGIFSTHSLTCTHSQNYQPNKNMYWTDRYWSDRYWTDMYWTDMYWTNMCTSVYAWYTCMCV